MKRKKVLIADDEQTIRHMVCRMLGKEYIVLEAEDGETALNIARTEKPDIVLMDFMMPKLDGVGACSIIKSDSLTEGIPVIIISARGQELDQEYARDMGADGYITKPFGLRDLLETVHRLLPT
jgi:two-component system alkaline phosphatase synthesis response regulator PhoP